MREVCEMGENNLTTVRSNNRTKKFIRAYKLELGMTLILMLLYIVLHFVTGTALTSGNLLNVLQSSAPLLIMTMGQLVVIITGGIDLSVGSIYSLSGMCGTLVMLSTQSIASWPVWSWERFAA